MMAPGLVGQMNETSNHLFALWKSSEGKLKNEIKQVIEVVETIEWNNEFTVVTNNTEISHQTAYNKRFEIEFDKLG